MSRINTNVQSLIAQRVLGNNNKTLNVSLERLSTGLRVNRGSDDPAGLIGSENLRAEKTALAAAISNAQRAEQVVGIAEGGLTEISSLLNELEGLVTTTANTAGLSSEEKDANQLQIDSILQSIDRIAASTNFQGTGLLNGNFDYQTTGVNGAVSSFQINGAKLDNGSTLDVDVLVTGSAQVGGYFLSFGSANLDLGGPSDQFKIEIGGLEGARELSFASGTALTEIQTAINTLSDVTGVKATLVSGTGIRLESSEVGSDQFVSVKVLDAGNINIASSGLYEYDATDTGTANTTEVSDFVDLSNASIDKGKDVSATINGITATTKGSTVSINTDFLQVEVELDTGALSGTEIANSQNLGKVDAFTITGGGADFQLASKVDIAGKVSIGISNVAARTIGSVLDNGTRSFLSDLGGGKGLNVVDGDINVAQKVVSEAIRDISSLRGRLGAFNKNTIGTTIRALGVSFENVAAAESAIRDADFATETAELTRSQILVSSTTNALALSNSQPQNVLSLLG